MSIDEVVAQDEIDFPEHGDQSVGEFQISG